MNKLTQHWSPILKNFKMNDFFFLLLDIDKDSEDAIITPSQYNKQMTMNTEERLRKLKCLTRKVKMRSEPSINTLKVFPDIVIFQKYNIGDVLSVPVTVLNVYEVSKLVRIMMDSTTIFTITHNTDVVCTKIAPGMTYNFNVIFNVREVKEYCHSFTVETDSEIITVLIVCLHPRPLLDIPDTITLPTTPVKTVSERVLLVRNMGEVPAIFNMSTTSSFSVSPDRGILGPGKNLQISLSFTTQTLGDHTGRLQITYDTTECLTVNLKTCTTEANIKLEYTNIEMPNTYMGLKRRKFIKLFNNSSHLVYFKWQRYKNFKDALKEYTLYKEGFKNIKALEAAKWFGRVQQGIIDNKQTHEMIYERIYRDELREYENQEKFLYKHSNFAIHPLFGEVWPESSAMFILEFYPTESLCYGSTMYLEVAGKSERIPLHIYGCGIGPSMELNIIELEANDIFLCAIHQYEVAVHNKGHIPGTITFNPTPLEFGGIVSFNPTQLNINPGCYGAFVMKFTSKIQGKFVETIEFIIKESGEVLKFTFQGNIICPLLNFDISEIDFGDVTLGRVVSQSINLINTTQVPIEYKVSIVQDGTNPALTCEEYAADFYKTPIFLPKEFTFNPEEDIVMPNSTLVGELILLPNVDGSHMKRLYMSMWGTAKYSLSLPIKYRCMTPEIECKTKDIFMRGCFINYVYTRTVILTNLNEHSGYFVVFPQDFEEGQHITYSPQIPEDYIDAFETKEVQLDISTSYVGQSTADVYISIFGNKEKLFICSIRCNGQGPVITVPEALNFEDIRTLVEVTLPLEVVNDSPVPATVTITQLKKSIFKVSETVLQLDPTERKEITVTVYLREPGRFVDKLVFSAVNSESQTCNLSVRGVGSSILSEPELSKDLNLGYLLTYVPFTLSVTFTNMGRQGHKIIWSRTKKLKSFKQESSILVSVFSLTPAVFDLAPGQSIECVLAGSTPNPGIVEEDFYCHASIDNKPQHGVVDSFIVTAHFVRPVLELSKREMKFRVDRTYNKLISFLKDNLIVNNVSKLGITANVNITPPFFIRQNNESLSSTVVTLQDGASMMFVIQFVPLCEEQRCTVAKGQLVFSYADHPYKDIVPLIGEVNYPNLTFEPPIIDFGCLPNFFGATQKMVIKNVSPIPVSFHWEWIRDDFRVNHLDYEPTSIGHKSPKTSAVKSVSVPEVRQLHIEHFDYHHSKHEFRLPTIASYKAIETQPSPLKIVQKMPMAAESLHFKEMQTYLYQLVQCYCDPEENLEPVKLLPKLSENRDCIREFLDLIPSYGYLGPYESQVVSFEFNPCPNSEVDAVAHCHLRGGNTGIISVKGKSSNLSFSIESDLIEFGRQLFCEMCEKKVLIRNTGHAELDVHASIKSPYMKALDTESVPAIGNYGIKTREINKDVEMTVRYFPGTATEFTEPLTVQVGYFEPFTLSIHGYAMPAQAFCDLPRPSLLSEKAIILSYQAIGKFTPNILNIVKDLTGTEKVFEEGIPHKERDKLKSEGWEIISTNEILPTDIDIQMATEREVIEEILQAVPNILNDHTSGKCDNAIPIEPTLPYLIDFGFVVRNNVVNSTSTVLNYGPLRNNIRLVPFNRKLIRCGFTGYIGKKMLDVGESTDLVIIFNPSSDHFNTVNSLISDTIYLSVPHGQRIPIELRAFVTLPYVSCTKDNINFDVVTLGNCIQKVVILENRGFVQSTWFAKIECDTKGRPQRGQPVFFIKVTTGVLNPEQACAIDVYFQPSSPGVFRSSLVLTVQENENKVVINLKGIGYKPTIKIDRPIVEFPPTLPYIQNVEAMFTIENGGSFPIEFFLADYDTAIVLEENVINMLLDYYKAIYLYLPQRKAGNPLPPALLKFYENIMNSIGQRLQQEQLEKGKRSISVVSLPKSPQISPKNSKVISSSKISKDKKVAASTSNQLLKVKSQSANTIIKKKMSLDHTSPRKTKKISPTVDTLPFGDLLKNLSPSELREYIKQEFLTLKNSNTEDIPDPVRDALNESKPLPTVNMDNDVTKGLLLIFHGAPYTNYFFAANKTGRQLDIPVLTVDELLFNAIVKRESLAAIKVSELISQEFRAIASQSDLIEPPGCDGHDRLQKKIDLLSSGKIKKSPKRMGSKGSTDTKSKASANSTKKTKSKQQKSQIDRSKTSTNSTKQSVKKIKEDKRSTFIGLPENLLYEILEKELLSYSHGLIVPSLDSKFVRQPIQVLQWILKSVKNLRYIHFILFSYTYVDYTVQTVVVKEQEQQRDFDDKKSCVLSILEMDGQEFASVTNEEFKIFRQEVLIPRKQKFLKRQEEIRYRINMRAKGLLVKKQTDKNEPTKRENKDKKDGDSKLNFKEKKSKESTKTKKKKDTKSKESTTGKKTTISKPLKEKKSKTSTKESKLPRNKSKTGQLEAELKKRFDDADKLADDILHTLEYWNRETGTLTKDLSEKRRMKFKPPKGKTGSASSKKSSPIDPLVGNVKEFTEEEKLQAAIIGIPCWLLRHDVDLHTQRMVDMLTKNVDIVAARAELRPSLNDRPIEVYAETCSVVQRPYLKVRVPNVTDIFSMQNGHTPTPKAMVQSPSTKISKTKKLLSSSKTNVKKRSGSGIVKKSKSSTDSVVSVISGFGSPTGSDLMKVESLTDELTKRAILNPGQKISYKLKFVPKACGDYEHAYTIELVGWPTKYLINCKGKCDIPKLTVQPSVMFANSHETRPTLRATCSGYIINEEMYEFGPTLISSFAARTRLLERSAAVLLKNDSALPCTVSLKFLDDASNPSVADVFRVSKAELYIESENSEEVTVTAQPVNVGNTTGRMAIIVANNPMVESITFNCLGVDFPFFIEPNEIRFERSRLNQIFNRSFTLYNESQIPANWKILNPEKVSQYFKLSQINGFVGACARQNCQITFVAAVLEDSPLVEMDIQIFHANKRLPHPLRVFRIEISAEVLNVEIDCPREVNVGEVKARIEHHKELTILSRIKYDMTFKFTDVDKYPRKKEDASYRSLFKVTPETLTVSYGKPSTAIITFFSKKCVEFSNIPIFKCVVIDPPSQNVMMDFVITGSAKTYLSKYQLCPSSDVYFGHQLVGTERTEQMSLRNMGKFDFAFSITSLKKVTDKIIKKGKNGKQKKEKKGKGKKGKGKKSKSSVKLSRSKSKSSKTKKSKSSAKMKSSKSKSSKSKKSKSTSKLSKGKKDKNVRTEEKEVKPNLTKLDVGCFTVTYSANQLQPHESTTITVTSKPNTIGLIEEVIIFFISECSVKDKKGIPVLLSVKGDTPSVDFTYIQDIFCEQYIVESIADFHCAEQVDNHCYFVKSNQTLYFSKTCINNTTTTRLRFQSTSAIVTELFAEILNKKVFSVKPEKSHLNAFEHAFLELSFTPLSITEYSETLEVRYSTSVGNPVRYSVELKGEGYVPELRIIEPMVDEISNACWLIFNPVFVGKSQIKQIVLENIGAIECKVMLEVHDDSNMLFFRVKHYDLARSESSAIMSVNANSKASCELEFIPSKDVKLEARIIVFIVNNPFEFFCIHVLGESFIEDIVLENVPALSMEDFKEQKNLVSAYSIDFGCCPLNVLQKKIIKIKNNSILNIYRFEFPSLDKVVFIPSVGHLKPGASKHVIVTFLSREPVSVPSEILELTICQIQFTEPERELLSWDERQNIIRWSSEERESIITPKSSGMFSSVHSQDAASRKSSKVATSAKSRTKPPSKDEMKTENDAASETFKTPKKKKLDYKPEPPNQVLADSSKTINLIFSVNADYCNYETDVPDIIQLEDTLMFEKRSESFIIKNTSIMPIFINWNIQSELSMEKRLTKDSNVITRESSKSADVRKTKCDCKTGIKYQLHGSEIFIDTHGKPSRPTTSVCSLSSLSVDAAKLEENLPFTIDPSSCEIPPNEQQSFKITFSPIEASEHLIHFKTIIYNVNPIAKPLDIVVKAKGLLPLYHFDIGDSEYLVKHRYGKRLCEDLADRDTKVVEITGIGLRVNHLKTFHIMNPTGESFDYKWERSSINTDDVNLFNCLTPRGKVEKGKLAKCTFSFLPQELGTFEGFYVFTIEKYDLKRNFLIVGIAKNPCVYFTVPHLKLQPTLLRMVTSSHVTLKNNEHMEVHFKMLKKSLYNGDRSEKIVVEPVEGNISAGSEVLIKIWCTPKTMGDIHFILKCDIEYMEKPLSLAINTSAYEVEPAVYHILPTNKITMDHNVENTTSLRSMVVNQEDISKFIIKNNGKIGFYYKWRKVEKYIDDFVAVTFKEIEGYCIAGEENNAVVILKPVKHLTEKVVELKLKILYGPEYKINFTCTTAKTKYKFSFVEYDFGACLVQKETTDAYRVALQFSNGEDKSLLLEFRDEMLEHLSVKFKAKEIPPKTVETIQIYFHPLQPGDYLNRLQFWINTKSEKIVIKGKGVMVDIVLEDFDDRFVNFGPVLVGKTISKTMKVINRTSASVNINFNLFELLSLVKPKKVLKAEFERPPPPTIKKTESKKKTTIDDKMKKKGKKGSKKGSKGSKKSSKVGKKSKSNLKASSSVKSSKSSKSKKSLKSSKSNKLSKKGKGSKKSDKKGKKKKEKKHKKGEEIKSEDEVKIEEPPAETPEQRKERLIRQSLTITPKKNIKLAPGAKGTFTITYSPTERMQSFHKKIYYQVEENVEPLCVVQASCVAPDYYIDRTKIALGSVVKGCQSENKFTLYNVGDVGGKYRWLIERKRLSTDTKVTISPMEGYISPDTSVTFTVLYQPNTIQCYVRLRLSCKIEKYNKPLEVIFTGSCINTPPPTATVQFSCPVRSEVTEIIDFYNNTENIWKIYPQITGDYFTVSDLITLDPNAHTKIPVSYHPLQMTYGDSKHKAMLYLPQPDGWCYLYKLEGTSIAPQPVGVIEREIFCKTYYTVLLKIKNWTKALQQFNVVTINTKPAETVKILYKLTGNDLVDVAANLEKDYYWGIYVINTGILHFDVLFKNQVTKEYLYYQLVIKVVQGGPQKEIYLKTCVRQKVSHELPFENPIKTPVTYTLTCDSKKIIFPTTVTVPPLTEEMVTLSYFPLFVDKQEANLIATATELGQYTYKVFLIAMAPISEPGVVLKCGLGQSSTQKVLIDNFTQAKSEYRLKITEGEDFSFRPELLSIDSQGKGRFEVIFQPTSLGNAEGTLKISSPTAGEYIYPLRGICDVPKPQGPIKVPHSQPAFITFRNPFNVLAKFNYLIESTTFGVRVTSETLVPFGTTKIEVFMKITELSPSTSKFPFTGKLVVICVDPPQSHIKWVYYLQSD